MRNGGMKKNDARDTGEREKKNHIRGATIEFMDGWLVGWQQKWTKRRNSVYKIKVNKFRIK